MALVRGWPFPFLVITSPVKAEEELLYEYGASYWTFFWGLDRRSLVEAEWRRKQLLLMEASLSQRLSQSQQVTLTEDEVDEGGGVHEPAARRPATSAGGSVVSPYRPRGTAGISLRGGAAGAPGAGATTPGDLARWEADAEEIRQARRGAGEGLCHAMRNEDCLATEPDDDEIQSAMRKEPEATRPSKRHQGDPDGDSSSDDSDDIDGRDYYSASEDEDVDDLLLHRHSGSASRKRTAGVAARPPQMDEDEKEELRYRRWDFRLNHAALSRVVACAVFAVVRSPVLILAVVWSWHYGTEFFFYMALTC